MQTAHKPRQAHREGVTGNSGTAHPGEHRQRRVVGAGGTAAAAVCGRTHFPGCRQSRMGSGRSSASPTTTGALAGTGAGWAAGTRPCEEACAAFRPLGATRTAPADPNTAKVLRCGAGTAPLRLPLFVMGLAASGVAPFSCEGDRSLLWPGGSVAARARLVCMRAGAVEGLGRILRTIFRISGSPPQARSHFKSCTRASWLCTSCAETTAGARLSLGVKAASQAHTQTVRRWRPSQRVPRIPSLPGLPSATCRSS